MRIRGLINKVLGFFLGFVVGAFFASMVVVIIFIVLILVIFQYYLKKGILWEYASGFFLGIGPGFILGLVIYNPFFHFLFIL